MNRPETNDPLDTMLREQIRYVEDDGFTARVIAVLPRARRSERLRSLLLLGATAIGYALALAWLPWGNILNSVATFSINTQTVLNLFVLLLIGGSLLWGVFAAAGAEEY